MNREKGFTLIEIVMVIILLGILAAVAIPRFIDMSGEAKKSSAKGVIGGARGSIAIAYANNALRGHAGYPSVAALRNAMSGAGMPANPFNNDTTIVSQTGSARTTDQAKGWGYSTDTGLFYSKYSTAGSKSW